MDEGSPVVAVPEQGPPQEPSVPEKKPAESPKQEDPPPPDAASHSKAQAVLENTQALFQRLGSQARDAAIVAGQKLDKAAMSVGAAVDNYAIQIGNAYDQHVTKELAQAVEHRERHRQIQETEIPPERQEQILIHRTELIEQCVTLTGDIQQEIQYASKDNPLGRESYGLMMLVNVLVPILEHGLRQDWKSILPASTVLSSSSLWAQSLVKQTRRSQPTAFDVLQAADQGWDKGQSGGMGLSELPLSGVQGGRRVQIWLYDSLNKGLLAGRIQALMLMSDLLEDWYFSWALLRTEGSLQDVLTELVKIESQEGYIQLPLEQLVAPNGKDTFMNGWSQKMQDTFHSMAGRAREASKMAYSKASASYSRMASAVRPGSQQSSMDVLPAPEHATPHSVSQTPPRESAASPSEPSVLGGDTNTAGQGGSDFGNPDDDEDALIVHAGFSTLQQPVAASTAGAPVFLGIEDTGDDSTGQTGDKNTQSLLNDTTSATS